MKLVVLMLAASLQAQVVVKLTPEPIEVSRERFGALRTVTLWNVRVCNNSAAPVRMDAIRIAMATNVPLLSKASSLAVLKSKRSKRPVVIATQLLELGGFAASGLLGVEWIPVIALGRTIGQRFERIVPPAFDSGELLDGQLDLAPVNQSGNCVERSVLAYKQRNVKAERFSLTTEGVTSYGSMALPQPPIEFVPAIPAS
jgi:hypothetical protein